MTNPYNQPPENPYGPGQPAPVWGQNHTPAAPEPPKQKWTPFKTGLFGCLGLVVAGLSLFAGCAALGGLGAAVNDSGGSGGSTVASETTEPAVAETTAPPELTAGDVDLKVKTISKQCYGYGVGCNVEYRVVVDGAPAGLPGDVTYEVTYEVRGPETGAETGTLTITGDQYETTESIMTMTSSKGVKLKAKVTEVVPQ